MSFNWKKTGLFGAGVLFGTAGIKILTSDDAKNVYTECTAAVLRAKECVLDVVSTVQENCGDIYAGAKKVNETRAAKKAEVYEDAPEEEETEEAQEETAEA